MKKLLSLCLMVTVFLCLFVGCLNNSMEKAKAPASNKQGTASLIDTSNARFVICDGDGNAVITENHIEQANHEYYPAYDCYCVHIQLDRTGTELLNYITSQNIGKKLPIYLDDELIYEPKVNDRVDDGEFYIMVDSERVAVELYDKIASAMHGEQNDKR